MCDRGGGGAYRDHICSDGKTLHKARRNKLSTQKDSKVGKSEIGDDLAWGGVSGVVEGGEAEVA